jgi:ABC-type uncharacterized transport system auxiliary subunit
MKIRTLGSNGRHAKGNRRNIFRWNNVKPACGVLALTLGGVAGGCGGAHPMQYYQLTVPTEKPHAEPNASGVSLALGPLVASHLYREDRIVYSAGTERMGTYEYQRWTEPPAEMIEEMLLRELRASGRYRDVSLQRSSSRADYVLHGRLYDFKEVAGEPLQARVTADFDLKDVKSGATVWSHYNNHDEAVGGKDVPAMVAALDRNVQRCVEEIKGSLDQYFSSQPASK